METNAADSYSKNNYLDFLNNFPELKQILLESKLLDIIPGGFAIATDVTCQTIIHNPVSAKFLGIEPWAQFSHSAPKMPPVKVYQNDELLPPSEMPMQQAAWFGKEVVGCELEFVWEDGSSRIARWSASPLHNEKGIICGCIATMEDITDVVHMVKELKEKQELLLKVEKEKNEALQREIRMKDEFTSIISHELRTPLTIITSAIQTMELICKNELSSKAKEYLAKIKQNSNRQLKLVNNLLDIARIQAGHLKMTNTNIDIVLFTEYIIESIKLYAEQKNITLSFSSTLKRKVITIDEDKYERILLNLLSNAIKFTPAGKSIAVKLSRKIVGGNNMVSIQVRDEGAGIPADKKDLVFQRFGQVNSSLTSQAEGTGLGLHLVKLFVKAMGGEITLESEVGVGSTFAVILTDTKSNEAIVEKDQAKSLNHHLHKAAAIQFSDFYF